MSKQAFQWIVMVLILSFISHAKTKIVIGYLPLITQLPLIVEYENEKINDNPFTMELVQYGSTTALEAAVRVGAVQIAVLPIPQVIAMSADEIELSVLGSMALGGSSLLSKEKTLLALKGKVIGLTGFDSNESFVLQRVLEKRELIVGIDFKIMGVALSTIIQDLEDDKLDAIYLPEPYGSLAKEKGLGDFIMVEELLGQQNDLIVVQQDFFNENKEVMKIWYQLLKKAITFINEDIKMGQAEILTKLQSPYFNIPEKLFNRSLNEKIGAIQFGLAPVDKTPFEEAYTMSQESKLITKSINTEKLLETKLDLK
ncbi:ABC transporter substrate-binding protein [bacterium]|nr:ABC transporter substrate-binding protein [bacterium]